MSEIRFGVYRVVEALGSGAISSIYRAVQEPLGRVVALKALKAQISPASSFGEQLDREATILRDLAHPNVVLLLDVGRTASGRPFLVLENVEGPSLQQLLAKKRALSVEAALAVAAGICSALGHVHERGVVHRDVKPGNVLLTRAGVVKMIDFGIAQRVRTANSSEASVAEGITPSGRLAPEIVKDAFGTPAYMSPEQILGDFVDGRSDLFSLGVVLYQMLSGRRPFESPTHEEGASARGRSVPPPSHADRSAAQRIRRDAPAPLRARAPHVPRAVERLVMRLLEKSPNERYANAPDVLERLQRELRAMTREDPASVVRSMLVSSGFARATPKASLTPPSARYGLDARRAVLGHALILVAFLVAVFAVEGGSFARARDGLTAGHRPLELLPGDAFGLRVLATPWAHVSVDGQQVETTPFARPIPLPAGKHWITLTHPNSPAVEREIDVARGETVTLDVTMAVGTVEDAGKDAR